MEETTRLIKQAHDGDPEAREQLVLKNVGLVWSIVRRFAGRGHELEDLYQIGCIGLIKAIDKFNLEFDVMIKVSRSLKELGIRVSSVREQMTWELGREPGLDELANRVGASREEVAASIEASTEVESIDKNVGNGEDQNLRLLDKLPDQREEQEQLLNRMVLGQILNLLEEKDREIIVRRYFENQTQSQIAGVTAGKKDSSKNEGISQSVTRHTNGRFHVRCDTGVPVAKAGAPYGKEEDV